MERSSLVTEENFIAQAEARRPINKNEKIVGKQDFICQFYGAHCAEATALFSRNALRKNTRLATLKTGMPAYAGISHLIQ